MVRWTRDQDLVFLQEFSSRFYKEIASRLKVKMHFRNLLNLNWIKNGSWYELRWLKMHKELDRLKFQEGHG